MCAACIEAAFLGWFLDGAPEPAAMDFSNLRLLFFLSLMFISPVKLWLNSTRTENVIHVVSPIPADPGLSANTPDRLNQVLRPGWPPFI